MDTAYEIMSETVADKRLKWLDQAKEWLVLEGQILRRVLALYQLFQAQRRGIPNYRTNRRKVVFKRKDFVNAITHTCDVLGLGYR